MITKELNINGKIYNAHESKMGIGSLVYIKTDNGYIMCGYLNKETAEKLNDIAAVVTGISSAEEMLEKTIGWVSSAAIQRGVNVDMPVKIAINLM